MVYSHGGVSCIQTHLHWIDHSRGGDNINLHLFVVFVETFTSLPSYRIIYFREVLASSESSTIHLQVLT